MQNSARLEIPGGRKGIFQVQHPYQTPAMTHGINSILQELDLEVRVLGLDRIHPDFSVHRHCLGRSYLYRLAVLDQTASVEGEKASHIHPVFEHNRSWPIQTPFDVDKAQEFAKMLEVSDRKFLVFRQLKLVRGHTRLCILHGGEP